MSQLQSGIYIITNSVNGKCYIGSAVNLKKRWVNHTSELRQGKHSNKHLQSAWNKYDADAFTFTVLLYCSKEDLLMFEQRALDTYKPEYNILMVAGSPIGKRHSDETRAKMSLSAKAHKASPEVREKISKFMSGRVVSPETRIKTSSIQKGNTNALGYKHTPEAKVKISEARHRQESAKRRAA